TLGPGYLEVIYEKAMAVEMSLRGLAFSQQVPIELRYKGQPVGEGRLDLLVDSQVIVELKAVESLATIHQAQLLSYLRATGLRLGLLLNFNVPVLRDGIMRVVL
ncbi:MAG: GxxExxY protein, partial [Phycisphaeraceae bacterium]|nr:GxxExxY protein [Phycisphaeraceae bacterium]